LFTAYASHSEATEEYIYLGSAEGCLYKLIVSSGITHWIEIDQTNPISQSMCILGKIDMIEQGNHNTVTKADILLYAGESSDSQVLAVKETKTLYN
jgi:metal-dependent hydrolase (beta-lactamase superfamily II)